jgi:AcrR family transcriptional regulator
MDQNKDEIRENIVKIASTIFGRFGFKKTTVDEIAKAARKGKSTIYYYFTSKEDIFKSVIEKEAQYLRSELIAVLGQKLTPQEKLKKYILTRISVFKNLVNYYGAIKEDYLSYLPFIEEIREKYDQEEILLIKMLLIEGTDKKIFFIDDIQSSAESLALILKGLEYPMILKKMNISDIETRLDKILNLVYKGILKS